jgi:hypothetical protein
VKRSKGPPNFFGYIHDMPGPLGSILSVCCEGPECVICARDPAAAKRAKSRYFPHETDESKPVKGA